MKTIPYGKDKEYVLVSGVSSVFVVLHSAKEMNLIHCFENIHYGPIIDVLFHRFSIYFVSNLEPKVGLLSWNEKLGKKQKK